MATENESSESQQPSAISTSSLNQTTSGFLKNFSDVAKFTVFIAFAFYTLGFIIWQSYLGNYGLSSISFLQTEYVSSAFCYLIVFLGLAYPSIFILAHTLMVLGKTERGQLKKFDISDTLFAGSLVFLFLILIFIPSQSFEQGLQSFPFNIGKGFLVCLVLGIVINKLKIPQNQKPLAFGFYNTLVMDIYFPIVLIVFIFSNKEIDKLFILYSVVVIILIRLSFFKEISANMPNMHKVLWLFIVSLALLGNILYFGKYQFQYIPKQVGGGKPEKAYLKFSPEHKELAESLNLTPAADINISSGFYGPVAILLRSENEIIFLDFQNTKCITNAPKNAKEVQANLVDAIIFQK